MKIMIVLSLLGLLVFSGCTHKSAGIHINSNGKGGIHMKGGVLKF